jgi:hypothetical protein
MKGASVTVNLPPERSRTRPPFALGRHPSVASSTPDFIDSSHKNRIGIISLSKELVAGFALIQAKSKQDAIEYTKRFLKVAGDGETGIRQVCEASDVAPGA